MFKKNHENRQEIPTEDSLDLRLQQMGQKISAPYKLRNAAKTGIPLKVRDAVKTSVHVKHFARAVIAYSLCVCLLVGGVLIVPGLFEGANLAGSQVPADTTDDVVIPPITDASNPLDTEDPPSDFPPPDGIIPKEDPICGDALAELIAGKTNVNAAGMVNLDSIRSEGYLLWHKDKATQALQMMFDNLKCSESDCGPNSEHELCAGGGFAEGADAHIYFDLTAPAKVDAYMIRTSWNNNVFVGRNPIEWVLYATNDPTLPLDQWAELDDVYDGNIPNESFLEVGYKIDADKQDAYQYYCWRVAFTGSGSLNVDEFSLYVG